MDRRNALKAGLSSLAVAGVTSHLGRGQEQAESATPATNKRQPEIIDHALLSASRSAGSYMFREELTTEIESKHQTLIITSARDVYGKPTSQRVKSSSVSFFRVDAAYDDFTVQGGWYWKCGEQRGKLKFEYSPENLMTKFSESAGPLVMVVRRIDGSVQWYLLDYDLRC